MDALVIFKLFWDEEGFWEISSSSLHIRIVDFFEFVEYVTKLSFTSQKTHARNFVDLFLVANLP